MISKQIILDDGCTFTGFFHEEKRVFGVKTYKNGAKFIGSYKNDVRHGFGIKIHRDGNIVCVEYSEGVKC